MSEWIPVEERLPPDNSHGFSENVLVCDRYGVIGVDWYQHTASKWFDYGYSITHWQPLPEPPQIEGDQ